MLSLTASSTKTPPMMGSDSSVLVDSATKPSAPPSASAPTSPMNTWAGWVLNHRNPMPAPPLAPQNTASSPAPCTGATPRYWAMLKSRSVVPAAYDSSRNVNEQMMTGPMASPSRPSVRLTAFDSASSTKIPNPMYSPSGSDTGNFSKFSSGGARRNRTSAGSALLVNSHTTATPPMMNCPSSFSRPGRPFLFLREIFK